MSGNATIDLQNALQKSKDSIFFTFSLEFILQLPLSIVYLYLAFRGKTFYNANRFTLSLLISNGLAMLLFSLSIVFSFITVKQFVEAGSEASVNDFNRYLISLRVSWWVGLYAALCYNISHWIFAFKYWTLAIKVEQLKKGRDPNLLNRRFMTVLVIGIFANVLYSFLISFSIAKSFINDIRKRRLTIVALVF